MRSGARESMPGMMDSVLNLGLKDGSTAGLAARTGDERFAWDCYRRLVQMFGNVVRGIAGERVEDEIARVSASMRRRSTSSLTPPLCAT
jgi:pyruvate, orthophosphate dikinase